MIKKITAFIMICAVLICTFAACGDDDDIALIMPISSDPLCLDPQIAETDEAKLIIANCYEGLVRLNSDYEIIGGVAESWHVSDNGLTYTFNLRKGTNWQLLKSYSTVLDDDNYMENFKTQVTANDFRFALRRALDPITDSPDAEKLYCIKNARAIHSGNAKKEDLGVKVVDDYTLVITLERANPDFLRLLTLPICMPCNEEFFNATHAKYGLQLKYTFCNGPFYLARWAESNSLVMYKNEGYIGAEKVKPTAVYFNVNDDEESVVSKLKQLTYHTAFISDEAYHGLTDNKKIRFSVSENSVKGLAFNCADSVLSNADLRKALVMLINPDEIAKPEAALKKAEGIVPDCCRFANKSYTKASVTAAALEPDENAAFELWQKGLKALGTDSASVKIICTEEYSAQMQNAIQNWQRVLSTAIVAKVEVLSESDLNDAIKNDKFQIAVTEIKSETSTATDLLKNFTTENRKNIFNYSDPTYDKMFDEIINVKSGDDILKSMKNAEQYLINNAVFCPLFTYGDYLAISSEAESIVPSPAFQSISFITGGLS